MKLKKISNLLVASLLLLTTSIFIANAQGPGEEVGGNVDETVVGDPGQTDAPVTTPVEENAGETVDETVADQNPESADEPTSAPVEEAGTTVEEFDSVGIESMQLDDGPEKDLGPLLASGWVSTFQIVNSNLTAETEVSIDFYKEGTSTVDKTITRKIAAGGVTKVDASDTSIGLAGSWRGAVVVSSSDPVGVAVNQIIGGATRFAGSYSGIAKGSAKVFLPSVLRDYYGYENTIAIQGISGANSIAYTIKVYDDKGILKTSISGTAPLNGGIYVDLSGTDGAALGSKFIGSATVEATDGTSQLAVVVVQENPGGFTQSYEGFTSGAKTLYAAGLYDNYYEFISSINVQNVSDNCTGDIIITYATAADSPAAKGATSVTIPAVGPKIGTLELQFKKLAQDGKRWNGAATITSACDIVGIVNAATLGKRDLATANDYNQAQTYSAVSGGSKKVAVPLLTKLVDGKFSALTVQNVGTVDAPFTVRYSNGTTAPAVTLKAGSSQVVVLNTANASVAAGFDGGAIITSDQPIAVIVNQGAEISALNSTDGDLSTSYNGVSLE